MKQYKADQVMAVLRQEMKQRGFRIAESPCQQFPEFVNIYNELFGECYSGEQAMTNLINKKARPIFESLVQEACDPSFRLPKMTERDAEVWGKLERMITGNDAVTKCRSCGKKFNTRAGEATCSDKCKSAVRAKEDGMTCHVCSRVCTRRQFYDPNRKLFFPVALLDESDETLDTCFANKPEIAQFLMDTRRNKNPIVFCSNRCQDRFFKEVRCTQCGNEEANTISFPNLDALTWGRGRQSKDFESRADTQDWALKSSCKSCGAGMAMRHPPSQQIPVLAVA